MKFQLTPRFFYISIFIFLVIVITAFKQENDPFLTLLDKLNIHSSTHAYEKIHLHLDKPNYRSGDDIWLKGYLIHSKTNAPSALSKVMYVELISDQNKLAHRLTLPVIGGLAWGNFSIPDSIASGNYVIRAYTNYMRNFGDDSFFDKVIKISKPFYDNVFTSTKYRFKRDSIFSSIKITNGDGKVYANQEVSYTIISGDKISERGKVKTNAKGETEIDFKETGKTGLNNKINISMNVGDNRKIVKSISVHSNSKNKDVQFLTEGGILLEDLPQKIAIKAVGANGRGTDVTGAVVDELGNTITRFKTDHLGMGNFITNVQPGKTYKAKVKFEDGSEKEFPMPNAQKSGYALSVDNSNKEKVKIKVLATADKIGNGELKIVAQQNGNTNYVSRIKLSQQYLIIPIDKKELPTGIIQFTLFSEDNHPIAERIIFNKNYERKLNVKLDTSVLSKRLKGKSVFKIESKKDGAPIEGNFSVSVSQVDKSGISESNESHIFSSLLLTSDLKGYIENPNYYFLADDLKTNQNLDNLMLTHGWRRFLWKEIATDNQPPFKFLPETGINISGWVKYKNKPVENAKVGLMSKANGGIFMDTISNKDGWFSFKNLLFAENSFFTIDAKSQNVKDLDIELEQRFSSVADAYKSKADFETDHEISLLSFNAANDNYYKELKRLGINEEVLKLKDVTINQKRKKVIESANLNGAGNADRILTSEDFKFTSGSLLGDINNRLHLKTLPRVRDPLYILDGNSNIDVGMIEMIPSSEIETVELLMNASRTAIYGIRGSGGVIVITTKKGTGSGIAKNYQPEGLKNIQFSGYSPSKEFYSPQYETIADDNQKDFRSTIYWNPLVVTDKKGTAAFEFYNATEAGTYRMLIEGIDINGNLARKVFTYQVM